MLIQKILPNVDASAENRSGELNFEDLIAPISSEMFFNEYWQKKLLLHERKIAGHFDRLLLPADIDDLFAAAAANANDWYFFRSAENVPRTQFIHRSGAIQLNAIRALYRDGGTIHIRNTQRYLPRLEMLWHGLEEIFRCRVQLNFWLTRQNTFDGFLHYDTHDIIVLQLGGRKSWKIYEYNEDIFAPRNPDVSVRRTDVAGPAREFTMAAGDLLYIPAGTVHEVTTCEPHSFHLSIGIHPILWHDVLGPALKELTLKGGSLNAPVSYDVLSDPVNLQVELRRILSGLANEVNCEQLSEEMQAKFFDEFEQPVDRSFTKDVLAAKSVDLQDRLRRRPALKARLSIDTNSGTVSILFSGGGGMRCPIDIAPLLQDVIGLERPFTALDLSDKFDLPARLLVLTELLQRGLLEQVG